MTVAVLTLRLRTAETPGLCRDSLLTEYWAEILELALCEWESLRSIAGRLSTKSQWQYSNYSTIYCCIQAN